jgi:outer membrane protein assembly factor BamB
MGRGRAIAAWLPAIAGVSAALVAGVTVAVPGDDLAAIRAIAPMDLGTSWSYDVLDHGRPSGTRTTQNTGSASVLAAGGLESVVKQRRDYTDYPGSGPRSFVAYLGLEGGTVYQYAQEEGGSWYGLDPRIVAYRAPAKAGATWRYRGKVGDVDYSSTTELTEVVDVEVGGHSFRGCAHLVTTIPLEVADDPDAAETIDEWACPGIGTVRVHDVAEPNGVDFTEELTEFHGVASSWYADGHEPGAAELPPSLPGSTAGFDPERTFGVPDGTLGRELAWTDLRDQRALLPPASDGEVMVTAEPNGAVSLRTVARGEMRWRVQLRGPILAPPVIAGDLVLVADSLKRVWALSAETGLGVWAHQLPDVASATPIVVGDRVAVPSDDGAVTMLDAADGEVAWQTSLAGAARTAPAWDGAHIVTGDETGTLTALDPDTGDVSWSTSLDSGLVQGPLVADGRVLVEAGDGVVHAFEPDGSVAWQSHTRGSGSAPMAAANGVVLTSDNVETLTALDTQDGRRLWSRELPTIRSAPAIVGDEIVQVTRRGEVRVLGLRTGRETDRWQLPLPAPDAHWFVDVDPALVGDTLVLSAFGGGALTDTALFAYPVRAGATAAPELHVTGRTTPGVPNEPPLLAGDDAIVATADGLYAVPPVGAPTRLIASEDRLQQMGTVADGIVVAPHADTMEAVRLRDGQVLWSSPAGESTFGARPVVAGDLVVYPAADQGLVAVDLRRGTPRWVQPIADQYVAVSPLALPDGDILYGGGGLARFDGGSGEVKWRDATAHLLAAPAYAGGRVFAIGVDPVQNTAAITGYDAGTGAVLWSHPVADPPLYLAPAVQDGVVVGYDGRTAHAYDAGTGAELWSVTMTSEPGGAPYLLDGRVFLAQAGNGRQLEDLDYRVSVHDLRTGRFLGAWEPGAMPLPSTPDVGGAGEAGLFVPTSLALTLLEAR